MTEQRNTANVLLQQIRDSRSVGRKKRRYKSRSALYPATDNLMKLHASGASLSELQFYLEYRHDPPIQVASRTTIKNYIDKVKAEAQIIDEPLY